MKNSTTYTFYGSCVGWCRRYIDDLIAMIDESIGITRATFLKHINRNELRDLETDLGYATHPSQGLTMAADWHVSYHRSKYRGQRVYFFKHSGIEYVFTREVSDVE